MDKMSLSEAYDPEMDTATANKPFVRTITSNINSESDLSKAGSVVPDMYVDFPRPTAQPKKQGRTVSFSDDLIQKESSVSINHHKQADHDMLESQIEPLVSTIPEVMGLQSYIRF
jgi:hypothetical protein